MTAGGSPGGAPDGGGSDQLLAMSVLATEAWLEDRGWDEPPIVLALVEESSGELGNAAGAVDGSVVLVYLVLGEGDPYEILRDADEPDALALVVASEGYAWPDSVRPADRTGRPSDHPDRVEVRMVMAVTRAGDVLLVTRPRGGEPEVEHGGTGPLVDAMGAVMSGR